MTVSDFHDQQVARDAAGNSVYVDGTGHRRTYCGCCGVAFDVGGGCARCKPRKVAK